MGYFRQTVVGLSWMGSLRILSRVVSLVKILVLARLLSPAEFGLFSIAALILSFLEILSETGINIFLLQERKSINRYINDAWIISLLRGGLIASMILAFSPFLVSFFNLNNAYMILIAISVVPFIRGFINPAIVTYQKELLFNKEFTLRLIVMIVDFAVSIYFVLFMNDPVGIVFGLIASAFIEVLLSFMLVKPTPRLIFRFSNCMKILSQGKWITLYGILNFISQEGHGFIVGKMLGTASLGIYQLGYRISTVPVTETVETVNKVVLPVFVKISSNKQRLLAGFFRTSLPVGGLIIAGCIIALILPDSLLVFILGPKWESVTSIFRILILFGMVRGLTNLWYGLFFAIKKQSYVGKLTAVRTLVLIALVIPLTATYGILGTSFSALISACVEVPFLLYLFMKEYRTV